ncbi:hypothetical protein ACFPOU_08455 [Massilia jejuensis]|uniref:Major capsid protein E n=1 Tax=Massilia jejuensis TaxID=648894 RepID=A0ABW0PI16_9BURK
MGDNQKRGDAQLDDFGRDFKSLEDLICQLPGGAAKTPMQVLEAGKASGVIKTAQFIQSALLLKRQSFTDMPLSESTRLSEQELKELDYALARGVITPTEFVSRYNPPVERKPVARSVGIAAIDEFQLYSDHLRIGEEHVELSDVSSVKCSASTNSLNLVRMSKSTYCTVSFVNRPTIHLNENKTYFQDKRHSAIHRFGSALAEATFSNRVLNLFKRLKKEGRVRLSVDYKPGILGTQPGVFLTADGHLETKEMRVNLKSARESGEILLGVNYGALNGISKEYRADEIAVSPNKMTWFKPLGGIVFTPTTVDPDVAHYAVNWFAQPNNRLTAQ